MATQIKQRSVLLTDVTGRPVNFVKWHRAARLVADGRAQVITSDEGFWKSERRDIPVALIIQLEDYVKLKPIPDDDINKRVLLARDNWECQYCACSVTADTATKDHVKPREHFKLEGRPVSDANTWDNIVIACSPCNNKKANRTPAQSGMYPRKTPKKPTYVQTMWAGKGFHPIQAEYVAEYFSLDPETLKSRKIKGPAHKAKAGKKKVGKAKAGKRK